MRTTVALAVLTTVFSLGAQTPPVVAGKDLPKVPGPMTGTRPLRDRSFTGGESPIELQIRRSARQNGTVPAVAVPAGDVAIQHAVVQGAGWMAYKVEAAPGERVKARLRGEHEGWFQVTVVNKFGEVEAGMLQNAIPTGNPEASYVNPRKEASTVYFVVDTTTQLTSEEPYTLTFTREAAPAKP